MKVLIVALLALAVSCAMAKPRAAGHPTFKEDQQIIPSASLVEAFETEIKSLIPREIESAPRKWVCYWFGCIWVPGWWGGKTTAAPTTTTTTEAPFECTSVGLFPDREDCSKYIVCQDGGEGQFLEHSMPCPAGLFFNSNTHMCDYPENVPNCQD